MKKGGKISPQERYDRRMRAIRQSKQAKLDKLVAANKIPFSDPVHAGRIDQVFCVVEAALREIAATGQINVTQHGVAVFYQPSEGCWFPIVPSFMSMLDTYAKLAGTHGWVDQTDGLRKLCKKIDVDMPLEQADIDRALASVAWMRERTLTITPEQFTEAAVDIQIRDELAALQAA